jgi:hypothetical protein
MLKGLLQRSNSTTIDQWSFGLESERAPTVEKGCRYAGPPQDTFISFSASTSFVFLRTRRSRTFQTIKSVIPSRRAQQFRSFGQNVSRTVLDQIRSQPFSTSTTVVFRLGTVLLFRTAQTVILCRQESYLFRQIPVILVGQNIGLTSECATSSLFEQQRPSCFLDITRFFGQVQQSYSIGHVHWSCSFKHLNTP